MSLMSLFVSPERSLFLLIPIAEQTCSHKRVVPYMHKILAARFLNLG